MTVKLTEAAVRKLGRLETEESLHHAREAQRYERELNRLKRRKRSPSAIAGEQDE